MATKISRATGDWTDAATWAVCDATSESDSVATNAGVGTTYSASSNFTPGAIIVDGVAVNFCGVNAISAITGTLSVKLYNVTNAIDVPGTETTVNVADIFSNDGATIALPGWRFIKFAAPVTLEAGKSYNLQLKRSSGTSSLTVYVSTGTNWSRQLRTTTTAAPAAGDKLFVLGELTGPGTGNDITVTMNNNDSTDYGGGSTTTPSLCVGKRGKLTWKTDATTNLVLSGVLWVSDGGTMEVGTDAGRIGSAYTATVTLDCAATGDFGVRVCGGGSLVIRGKVVDTCWTRLTADAAAGATAVQVESTAGWSAGDYLVFASTTRTPDQYETRNIATVDSATQVTLASALTYAHYGTEPHRGEVGNYKRNVTFFGKSTSICAYLVVDAGGTFSAEYCTFQYFGTGTTEKRGIDIATSNSTRFYGAVIAASYNNPIPINVTAASTQSLVLSKNILFNISGGATYGVYFSQEITGSVTITDNLAVNVQCNWMQIFWVPAVATCTGNAATSSSYSTGFSIGINGRAGFSGTFANNVAHSCNGGITFKSTHMSGGSITGNKSYFNVAGGLYLGGGYNWTYLFPSLCIENHVSFGEIAMLPGNGGSFVLKNLRTNGYGGSINYPGYAIAMNLQMACLLRLYMVDCDLGATLEGNLTAHTNDVWFQYPNQLLQIIAFNTKFGKSTDATEVSLPTQPSFCDAAMFIVSKKHDATAGLDKVWTAYGRMVPDTGIYATEAPSLRMTPSTSLYQMTSALGKELVGLGLGCFSVAVKAGESATVRVKVRLSDGADGAEYNGQLPRLRVEANPVAGIYSDATLATAEATLGQWLTLEGTTATVAADCVLNFYVDCGGTGYTQGWVNVDDWENVSPKNDTKGGKFWPHLVGDNAAAGAGGRAFAYIGG